MRRATLLLLALLVGRAEALTENLGVRTDTVRTSALTKVTWRDTTFNSNVYRLHAFNLLDPAQVWNYDAYRAAERTTSSDVTTKKRLPTVGFAITYGKTNNYNTAAVYSVTKPSNALLSFQWLSPTIIANNALSDSIWDGTFLDGAFYFATNSGLSKIDLLADEVTKWTTSGQSSYKGRVSDANSAKGWMLAGSTPAIVNNIVNAVSPFRSPYMDLRDPIGRPLQYWAAATNGGVSLTSYDRLGTLSIYDGAADTMRSVSLGPYYVSVGAMAAVNRDYVGWRRAITDIGADAWARQATYSDSIGTEGAKLRWGPATNYRNAVSLSGASAAGNASPAIWVASDSGAYRIDVKATDEPNGSKQEFNARYVSQIMHGNVMAAWSPASTASVGGIASIFSTAETAVSRTYDAASPLGAKWTFNGSTSVSRIKDNDSLTFVAGQPMSISMWANLDSLKNSTFASKWTGAGIASPKEWSFGLTSAGTLNIVVQDSTQATRIGRSSTLAMPTGWHHVVATYSGGLQNSSLSIWLDAVKVDAANDSSGSGSFTSMRNTSAPVIIGARLNTPSAGYATYQDGSSSPPVITREVLSPAQIMAEYQQGIRMMQSPTPDTLYSANVVRVKAQPYTGHVMLIHPSSIEIRDRYGVLSDTFACASCGTLSDGDFLRVAGVDSLGGGIVFGGSTGIRQIVPDPKYLDAAQARYPYAPYVIPDPAVVDSAGSGQFWTIQDALSALSNIGRAAVRVLKGTYPYPVTTVPTGAIIQGSGTKTLITNTADTSKAALAIAGDSVTVRDLRVYTAPNGAGNGKDGVSITGDYVRMERVGVSDADNYGININKGADYNVLVDCQVADADSIALRIQGTQARVRGGKYVGGGNGIRIDTTSATVVGATFSSAGSALNAVANGDSAIIAKNVITGKISVVAGNEKTIIDFNTFRAPDYKNYSSSKIDSFNAQ